jgi:hypothetical protein
MGKYFKLFLFSEHRLDIVRDRKGGLGLGLDLVDRDALGELDEREAVGEVDIEDTLVMGI